MGCFRVTWVFALFICCAYSQTCLSILIPEARVNESFVVQISIDNAPDTSVGSVSLQSPPAGCVVGNFSFSDRTVTLTANGTVNVVCSQSATNERLRFLVAFSGSTSPQCSGTLNVASTLNATTSQINSKCGEATGSASVVPNNGIKGYSFSYAWTPPSAGTNSNATGLAPGFYSVLITAGSQNLTKNFTITGPSTAFGITLTSKINVKCNGQSNGFLNMTISGGTFPYTWTESVPGSVQTFTPENVYVTANLSAGIYNTTVVDAKGCMASASFNITQPDSLSFSPTQENVLCVGKSTGSATPSVSGGTGPYTYIWSPGGQTTSTITNVAAGTYSVTVTDSNMCQATHSFEITQPASLIVTSEQNNVACNGGNTGNASVSVSGGTPPYTYLWSTGQNTNFISNQVVGPYSVTVQDDNMCSATRFFTITQPTALYVVDTKTDVLCGDGKTGIASVSVMGGRSPYTFSWSNGQTTNSISNLASGQYTVIVKDNNECTNTRSFTITQPAVLILNQSKVDLKCYGANTGSVNASVSGGTGPYAYLWVPKIASETESGASNLAKGNYTVTVNDSVGCMISHTFSISQPANLSIAASQVNIGCFSNKTGSVNASVTGGTPPYAYSWTPNVASSTENSASNLGNGTYAVSVVDAQQCTTYHQFALSQPASALYLSPPPTQLNVGCYGKQTGSATINVMGGTPPYTYYWNSIVGSKTASNLGNGNYIVVVRDEKGCTISHSFSISQPAALSVSPSQVNIECYSKKTGSATATVTGGSSPYSYSWSPNVASTSKTASNLGSGSYSVVVTDVKGCTISQGFFISEPAAILISPEQVNVSCYGSNTGSATASVTGGTLPYTYSWSSNVASSTSKTASNLTSGSYRVDVTDKKLCTNFYVFSISQPEAALSLSATQINVRCYGTKTGSALSNVTGGTLPYTYKWTQNASSSNNVSSLGVGNYKVNVTDGGGCSISHEFSISQAQPILISPWSVNVSCRGQTTGSAHANVEGGTPPYTYNWTSNVASSTSNYTQNLGSGNYLLTVTDSNGCVNSTLFVISEPAATLAIASQSQTNVDCHGQTTGVATVAASGGTPPYSYLWSGVGINSSESSVAGLRAGTYHVTVNDTSECSASSVFIITEPIAPLTIAPEKTDVRCRDQKTGEATATASGGTPPYSFSWSGGISSLAPNVSGLGAGIYRVTVNDTSGCSASYNIMITEPAAALAIALSLKTDVKCHGQSTGSATAVASGGSSPYSYLWSGGISPSAPNASELSAGAYTVNVSDANGCAASHTFLIAQPVAPLAINTSQTNVGCHGDRTGVAAGVASGGTAPYKYNWTGSNSTEETASYLSSGSYSITVMDAHDCAASRDFFLSEPESLLAVANVIPSKCKATNTGSAFVNISGGTPQYKYLWSNGKNESSLSNLTAGDYFVSISDAKFCSKNVSLTVAEPDALSIVPSYTNVTCYGTGTGKASISVSGGTPTYNYLWSTGSTNSSISAIRAGSYSVTTTDLNGCKSTRFFNITQPEQIFFTLVTTNATQADAANGRAVITQVHGGTPKYAFLWSNGRNGSSVADLAAGNYFVRVFDANNCTRMFYFTIFAPEPDPPPCNNATNPNCGGDKTNNPAERSATNAGAIAGGVVGGSVSLIALVGLVVLARRNGWYTSVKTRAFDRFFGDKSLERCICQLHNCSHSSFSKL